MGRWGKKERTRATRTTFQPSIVKRPFRHPIERQRNYYKEHFYGPLRICVIHNLYALPLGRERRNIIFRIMPRFPELEKKLLPPPSSSSSLNSHTGCKKKSSQFLTKYFGFSSALKCWGMSFLGAVQNKAFTNHTLKTVKVDSHITCRLECLGEYGCLSINFVKSQEGDGDCELNSSEDSQHPEDLEEREGTIYYSSEVGINSSTMTF